jgi:hypothetical protein
VVSAVVVVRDELADALFELSWQIVVFQQDPIFHRAAIVANEAPSTKPDDPNWIEYPAIMDPKLRRLLSEKAAELRKLHPRIDWSDGDGTPGLRRVTMWAPEL